MKYYLKQLLLGILAGLAIGLGSFLFILFTWLFKDDLVLLGKIIGSILFSIGLFLVCTFKLSLFTGKVGLVFEGKQETKFYISLPIMLIGNAIGIIALGYIAYFIFKDTDLINRAIEVSHLRTSDFSGEQSFNSYIETLLKAVFCGLFVYLAVKSFNLNRLKPTGILLLIFFVFTFVYLGFEHCIANMFYYSMANDWGKGAAIDLSIAIVGNIIGTIPGVFLNKLYLKSKQN